MATLTASKVRQVAAVTAAGLFVGLIGWILVTLASDFMLLFMVAAPCLSICYLISEVVKLWRHR